MGTVSIALPYDDRWYFAEVLRGIRTRLDAAGHDALVHVVPPSATSTVVALSAIIDDFASVDSLGAVAVGFKYREDQRGRALALQRPIVVIGGSSIGFPTVMIDDLGGARTATEHLLGLGHRRILHLAGELADQMDYSVHTRRARGYRQAMERHGLDPLIVQAEFDPEAVRVVAVEALGSDPRPTAVFAVSDEVAFGVIAAATELGLEIGRDLSLVGFDDHPLAEAAGLTTIRQRPEELGAAAADLLLSGIGRGPDPEQSRLMPSALVTRTSTRRVH